MVTVSSRLIFSHLEEPRVKRMFELLENDTEVQAYLRQSNTMVVNRMHYNDHGPVHARIAVGSALEIFDLLASSVEPTTVKDGVCDYEGAKLVVLCGSYLHDLGNAVHRNNHFLHSCYLAAPILDRLLPEVYLGEEAKIFRLKCEVLHTIYSHEEDLQSFSVEAGSAKVADGTDMAEGRARIPYRTGKIDIHSISATAIRRVDIERGKEKPVCIKVHMDNPAGVFQIEEVIGKKVKTSGLEHLIELVALENGREIKTIGSSPA